MKKIYFVVAVLLSLLLIGCGSRYTLKTGGWKLEDSKDLGTCLTVFGDGDPEVVVVCIKDAEPIKVPMEVLRKACPEPAEKSDGAE
tara:strand:- start:2282 stop:2539 length:258 start_codon:yes stop_codon:yes gene_type:complete